MNPTLNPESWKFSGTPEELQSLYEQARREFSEEDLKKFFTEEEGVSFEVLLQELEGMADSKQEPMQ